MTRQRPAPRRAVVLLGLMLAALVPSTRLIAHGGGTPVLTASPVGAYQVYAWITPAEPRAESALHLTIAVTLPGDGQNETPVTDADVTVTFSSDLAESVTAEALPGTGGNGVYYEVDAELPSGGVWETEISIRGRDGTGQVTVPLKVADASGIRWNYVYGGVLSLLVAAAVLAFAFQRASQSEEPMKETV